MNRSRRRTTDIHAIGAMRLVVPLLMLAHMPRLTKKSSSTVIPNLELSLSADMEDAAGRADQLEIWRVAAKDLASAYADWSAATRRDRRRCYLLFVDAFIHEETAARRLQRHASAPSPAHAGAPPT